MGGKSKSVTVGFRYYLGLHMAVSRTPWDALRTIFAGGRVAWQGNQTESGQIDIDAPELFGGDKKEGGIDGLADVMMGEPTQGVNDYLVSKIPGLMPAFRNMFSLVYRGGLIASINPYIKPWLLEGTRIKQGWGSGACWYPETAEIPRPGVGTISTLIATDYVNIVATGFADSSGQPAAPAGVVVTITVPLSTDRIVISKPAAADDPNMLEDAWSPWPADDATPPGDGLTWLNNFIISDQDDDVVDLINTLDIPKAADTAGALDNAQAYFPIEYTGSTEYKFWCFDTPVEDNRGVLSLKVETYRDGENLPDMNPAHIIYQLATDPDLEMGYPTADIDEDAFTYAADTFFEEGLGLTLSWNRQTKIRDFLQIVLDHAGAAFYADPFTGKFVLKPIRADYDPDYLDVYDESSIIAVEDFQRPGLGEAVNQIIVRYRDRINHAEAATAPDQDLASIQAQGAVISETREYPGFSHAAIAQRIAARDRKAASARLAKCRLRMNRALWNGTPAGVIKVSWAKLGLTGVIFRIIGINTGTLESGEILIDLVEDVFGLPDSSYAEEQPSGWDPPDLSPLPIEFEEAYELPYWDLARNLSEADLAMVDDDAAYVAATAARENGLQMSYDMWTRIAPADYEDVNSAGTFAPSVVLAAPVVRSDVQFSYSDPLDLSQITVPCRALIGTGRDAEWVLVTAIDEDYELLSVERGVLDTTPQEFEAGVRIFFVDEDNFVFDPTERATAEEIDVKLTSSTGMGSSSLDDATEMQVIPDQRFFRPYPPGNVLFNGEAFPTEILETLEVTWAHRDRLAQTVDYVTQDEGDIGPEAGTTYNVYLYDNDTEELIDTATGISGTSWFPAGFGAFTARVEIESERDGVVSWQRQIRIFDYEGDLARILENSAARKLEGSASRLLE